MTYRESRLPVLWLAIVCIVNFHLSAGQTTVRITCGAANLTENGRTWVSRAFITGAGYAATLTTVAGASTAQLPIYQSECFGAQMTVNVPVTNAAYQVTIKNTENWFAVAGARVFSVVAEGATVITDWDIYREAPGQFRVQDRTFTVTVTDGALSLTFPASANQARFAGIEVVPVTAAPSPSPSTQPVAAYYCGETTLTAGGIVWSPRGSWIVGVNGYSVRGPVDNTTAALSNMYGAECWGGADFAVNIPVDSGTYSVTLYNAETYWSSVGQRVFGVRAEGATRFTGWDIVAAAGGPFRATSRTFTVTVTDGTLNIQFVATVDASRLSGIVVRTSSAGPAPAPGPTPSPSTATPPTYALYCGGTGTVTQASTGITFSPITTYITGRGTYAVTTAITGDTADMQPVYGSECNGPMTISLPVGAGTYSVSILNAELWFETAGSRQFNVLAEGVTVISAWDIVGDTGGRFRAQTRTFTATVADGALTITFGFITGRDQPRISGVIVRPGAGAGPAPVPSPGPTPAPGPAQPVGTLLYSLYCGAAAVTGPGGVAWTSIDQYATGEVYGAAVTVPITGTDATGLQPVFQSECFGGAMTVSLPVTTGSYLVTIFNSENWWTDADIRLFNVLAEGSTYIANWDLIRETGGRYRAQTRSFTTRVTDGALTIDFQAIPARDNPRFAGIQVRVASDLPGPAPSPSPTPAAARSWFYTCKTSPGSFTDPRGNVWLPRDAASTWATATTETPAVVTDILDAGDLYEVYRYGCIGANMQLAFTGLPSGTYDVTLYNTESFFTTAGSRVFNYAIEGQVTVTAYDIYARVGLRRAISERYVISVTDGTLNIVFTPTAPQRDNGRISGISFSLRGTAAPSPVPAPVPVPVPSPTPVPVPIPSPVPVPVPVPSPTPVPGGINYNLNVHFGGRAFTDPYNGQPWVQGDGYIWNCPTTGCVQSGCTFDTTAESNFPGYPADYQNLYAVGCYLQREIRVPLPYTGTYSVMVIAAESYFATAGSRVWDANFEGQNLMSRIDVVALTGARYRPWNRTVLVPVTDGVLTINFNAVVDQPIYKGLRINYVDDQTSWLRPAVPTFNLGSQTPGLTEAQIRAGSPADIAFATHTTTLTAIPAMALASISWQLIGSWPSSQVVKATLTAPGGQQAVITNLDGETPLDARYWTLAAGGTVTLTIFFTPRDSTYYNCIFQIRGAAGNALVTSLPIAGLGDSRARETHDLHAVATLPQSVSTAVGFSNIIVNANGNGLQSVILDGTVSHTHDPTQTVTRYQWSNAAGTVLGTTPIVITTLPVGQSSVTLTIWDMDSPQRAARSTTDTVTVTVAPPTAVPGCFVRYYPGVVDVLSAAAVPVYAEVLRNSILTTLPDSIIDGLSVAPVTVRVNCYHTALAAGAHTLALGLSGGGVIGRMNLPGRGFVTLPTAHTQGAAGRFDVDLTLQIASIAQVPVRLLLDGADDANRAPLHDQTVIPPVAISVSPRQGSEVGGDVITVRGFAFRTDDVRIRVGAREVTPTSSDTRTITFTMPAGVPSQVPVSIFSKGAQSNGIIYEYLTRDDPPIRFDYALRMNTGSGLLAMAVCHSRTYIALANETIWEVSFDDNYAMTVTRVINALRDYPTTLVWGKVVLGMACDPWEAANSPWKLYFAHSMQGGGRYVNPYDIAFDRARGSVHSGWVSYLTAPTFATMTVAVRNLPCAVAWHGTGGIEFANDRELFVATGHMSNAGSPERTYQYMGDGPLASALLKMSIWRPDFNGDIQYDFRPGTPTTCDKLEYDNREVVDGTFGTIYPDQPYNVPGRSSTIVSYGISGMDHQAGTRTDFTYRTRTAMDQRVAHYIQYRAGGRQDIRPVAYGLRNALGVCQTLRGDVYITDNGPNTDSGWGLDGPPVPRNRPDGSLNCNWTRTATFSGGPDKLFLFTEGAYYGTPNMARAWDDERQWRWWSPTYRPPTGYPADPATAPYTPPLFNPPSSTDGMDEYRAMTFRGKMKERLWLCNVNVQSMIVSLRNRYTTNEVIMGVDVRGSVLTPNNACLYVKMQPGGAVLLGDYSATDQLKVLRPVDIEATATPRRVLVYDVFPNRAPVTIAPGAQFPFTIGGVNFDLFSGNIRVTFGGAVATITGRTGGRIFGYIPSALTPPGLVDVVVEDIGDPKTFTLRASFRYLPMVG